MVDASNIDLTVIEQYQRGNLRLDFSYSYERYNDPSFDIPRERDLFFQESGYQAWFPKRKILMKFKDGHLIGEEILFEASDEDEERDIKCRNTKRS